MPECVSVCVCVCVSVFLCESTDWCGCHLAAGVPTVGLRHQCLAWKNGEGVGRGWL